MPLKYFLILPAIILLGWNGNTCLAQSTALTDSLKKFRLIKPVADSGETQVSTNASGNKKITLKGDITPQLDSILDSAAVRNSRLKSFPGYRIVLYTGNSREEAKRAKESAYRINPDFEVYTQYKQPTFRVTVGNYLSKFDAQLIAERLKPIFPNVLISPENITAQ